MKDLVLTRKDLGDRVNYSGQYVFSGFKFNYTYNYNCDPTGDAGQHGDAGDVGAETNRQGKPGRGKVTLISPLDNKICMFDGPKARQILEKLPEEKRDKAKAGERIPELLMYKDFTSEDSSEKIVEEIVARKAKEIYAENEEQLRRIVGKMGESAAAGMDLMSAYTLYGKKFLAAKYSDASEKVKNENRRALEKISTQLCRVAISDLGAKDINKIIKMLGPRADRKLSVAEKFFDYCIDKKIVRCDNPFSVVKKSLKKNTRDAEAEANRARKIHEIPLAVEKEFNDSVLNNISNVSGKSIGFCLMKDAGVNIDDVCALVWNDIIIAGKDVLIKIERENYTGGTHNYSHPMMPFVSELIVRWHDYYVRVAGKKDFGKMYVIACPTDPFTQIKTSAMTDFVRKELKNMGIDRANIESPDKANSRGGAGAKLLSDHYANVLEQYCGIEKESGLGLFLRGAEIKETTTDFYRGLTGPEGIYCIQTLFNRDDRFSKRQEVNLDDAIKIMESDAGSQAIFAAAGPGRMTGAIGGLCVDAEEEIKIYAPHGVKGLIKARVCESDRSEGLDIPLVEA